MDSDSKQRLMTSKGALTGVRMALAQHRATAHDEGRRIDHLDLGQAVIDVSRAIECIERVLKRA